MSEPWNKAGYFPGPGLYAFCYRSMESTRYGVFNVQPGGVIWDSDRRFRISWGQVLYWVNLGPIPGDVT